MSITEAQRTEAREVVALAFPRFMRVLGELGQRQFNSLPLCRQQTHPNSRFNLLGNNTPTVPMNDYINAVLAQVETEVILRALLDMMFYFAQDRAYLQTRTLTRTLWAALVAAAHDHPTASYVPYPWTAPIGASDEAIESLPWRHPPRDGRVEMRIIFRALATIAEGVRREADVMLSGISGV